jgi:ADP-ribose pyrophosphatase YjhB (NUDIX family)
VKKGMHVSDHQWTNWARALQAISQTGLHFAATDFDKERYRAIGAIAADIIASHTTLSPSELVELHSREFGYATPKVDVRGVVFREDKIMLVREIADQGRWTLPGGWADVNESPREAVEREVFEESGFEVTAKKLLAVYDREKQGHEPPYPFHVYKLFFLCEIIGGKATPNVEASEIAFFDVDNLPELSLRRVTEQQLRRFFEHREHPEWPTDFD